MNVVTGTCRGSGNSEEALSPDLQAHSVELYRAAHSGGGGW